MIHIQNLNFAYKDTLVFNNLNLDLKPGYIYGLLGKNGTGKSTLFRNIAGLLFPSQGKIEALGYQPKKRLPGYLQQIFFLAEEFYLPNVSIKKFVASNAAFYPKFSQSQFEQYLSVFEVPLHNTLRTMSYGQKKKFLISFGLACNTPILLMDEPTNGLDILSKSQFRKVMASAVDDHKCIIISTHQVKDLESLIDRITIIDEGKILFDQSLETISQKLVFKITHDVDEVTQALYKEEALNGNAVILKNTNEEPANRVDLEMLYKSIILSRDAIQKTFTS